MRKVLCFLAFILFASACNAQVSKQSGDIAYMIASNLQHYQWNHRLLLVFAPSSRNAAYEKQMQLLQQQGSGLQERDMVLFQILAEGGSHEGDRPLDEKAASSLRQRFGINNETFCLILVGKDGTEKRREFQPTELSAIFGQIDAMPMRQREMQERTRG